MGQGIYTAQAMLLAEELDVELTQVRVEHAAADDKLYANPLIGFQVTGGSTSVRAFFKPLREAGATARAMLITAAAAALAGRSRLPARPTRESVIHAADRAAPGLWRARRPRRQAAGAGRPWHSRMPKDFKLIGTPAKRVDSAAKVDGTAMFGIDVRLPGMKIATVAACPVFGGKLRSVDDSRALAVRGVRQVVRIEDAVAVVADHMGAAKKGLEALAIEWDEGPNAQLSTADLVRAARAGCGARGRGRQAGGRRRGGAAGGREAHRGHLPDAAARACDHGAAELHRACPRGRLRGVDRLAGRQPGPGDRGRGDRPAARQGRGAQPVPRRRLRPAARGGLRHPGGAHRASRSTGRSRSSGRARRTSSTTSTGRSISTASPPVSMRRAIR